MKTLTPPIKSYIFPTTIIKTKKQCTRINKSESVAIRAHQNITVLSKKDAKAFLHICDAIYVK